jgi:small-conductance mechanosensitive channel
LVWLRAASIWLGVGSYLYEFGQDLKESQFTVGALRVPLYDVFLFPLVLGVSVMLAKVLRHVLDEDVFSRMSLGRGMAYSLAVTAEYAVISLGVVAAFTASGLDLSRFSFVAGALGVGIGFGLQNVVNNFVSGLILLYERPIQVGDIIQHNNLEGRVVHIGIRSSMVRTTEGADVIVPNSALLANELVNWTLTDNWRRIAVDVAVAYGSDPREVKRVLEEVAAAHPLVAKQPIPPAALLINFGDSAIQFQLRVWVPPESANRIGSELRQQVLTALGRASAKLPFAQRIVDPEPASSAGDPSVGP